jgi:hypothetical protein
MVGPASFSIKLDIWTNAEQLITEFFLHNLVILELAMIEFNVL